MAPALGIEDIIIPQFDQDEFADYIIKYKPNHIVGVPTHYTSLYEGQKNGKVNFFQNFLNLFLLVVDYFLEGNEQEFNEFFT